jgi:hypothetical protein
MLLYAPPKPNGGTAANIIRVYDRFTNFRTSVGKKPARPPQVKSVAQLAATQERSHSPKGQMYIADGCTHVAGDPAYWERIRRC